MPNQRPHTHQIIAFASVFIFVVFVCFYGVTESIDTFPAIRAAPQQEVFDATTPNSNTTGVPDLSRYEHLLTLSRKEFPIDEPGRRVIVVGDIHGMVKPLKKLLRKVSYDPSTDVLIHTGDILAKGSRKHAYKVLDLLIENNVRGVRGNHDQKVIEWRNWLDYIDTLPGGARWLARLERRWKERKDDSLHDVAAWIEEQELAAELSSNDSDSDAEKRLLKLIPKGWLMFSDHYNIAKGLTLKQFDYLLSLPLRIHVPSAHIFIAHAGVLPLNPKHPIDDKKRQPLARVPSMPRMPGPPIFTSSEVTTYDMVQRLRTLQELSVLTEIPQNTDPWVTLNMRGINSHGEIERDNGAGRPWTNVWRECMQSCVGYGGGQVDKEGAFGRENDGDYDYDAWDPTAAADSEAMKNKKKHKLPCYPSTTIYGHAASRGLDIKRWSFGLDTGCVYGRKLTAMVIEGRGIDAQSQSLDSILEEKIDDDAVEYDDDDDDEESSSSTRRKTSPFSDHYEAKFYSVRC